MNSRNPAAYRRRGAVLIWVAISLTMFCGFAALAIDMGYLFVLKNQTQTTADAAALAAVSQLPDPAAVLSVAVEYAGKNMPPADHGEVLTPSDVVVGGWDSLFRKFTPGTDPPNAVKVTTRRAESNFNPVPLFFAGVLGFNETDISAVAIAINSDIYQGNCFLEGAIAGEMMIVGEDAIITSYCIYGRLGVSLGQNTAVSVDSGIGSLAIDAIEIGQFSHVFPSGEPLSEDNVLFALDLQPTLALNVMQIIDDLQSGAFWPHQITQVVYMGVASEPPPILESGTAYIFDESIEVLQIYEIENVILASRKNISFGQNAGIVNIGDPTLGAAATGLYAGENIAIGQNSLIVGADIIAGQNIAIGQTLEFRATIQAGKDINLGEAPENSGFGGSLEDPEEGEEEEPVLKFRLVW